METCMRISTDYKRSDLNGRKGVINRSSIEKYWHKLKDSNVTRENDIIFSIQISPSDLSNIIYSCGTKSILYDNSNDNIVHTFVGKDNVLNIRYRNDGMLFCNSTESGYINIYDIGKHSKLRSLNNDTGTHVSLFSENKTEIFSGNNNGVIKLWDISMNKWSVCSKISDDKIKCGSEVKNDNNIFITGSYDKKIGINDMRIKKCWVNGFEFGELVENVLINPNGSIVYSCGSNFIKIYDMIGNKLLYEMSSHIKSITCLKFSHSLKYLHSSSLDCHINTYNMTNYQLIHQQKYSDSIIFFDISSNNQVVATSLYNNTNKHSTLIIKNIPNKSPYRNTIIASSSDTSVIKPKRYFKHNIISIKFNKNIQLTKYDKYLSKFNHQNTLLYVLNNKLSTDKKINILHELLRRNAIFISLQSLNVDDCINLLDFISKNIFQIDYTFILLPILDIFFDNRFKLKVFQQHLYKSPRLYLLFNNSLVKLHSLLRREIEFIHKSFELLGYLDLISLPSRLYQSDTLAITN